MIFLIFEIIMIVSEIKKIIVQTTARGHFTPPQ